MQVALAAASQNRGKADVTNKERELLQLRGEKKAMRSSVDRGGARTRQRRAGRADRGERGAAVVHELHAEQERATQQASTLRSRVEALDKGKEGVLGELRLQVGVLRSARRDASCG